MNIELYNLFGELDLALGGLGGLITLPGCVGKGVRGEWKKSSRYQEELAVQE